MEDNVNTVKEVERTEFDKIFETISKSKTSIPSIGLLSILSGIVRSSDKDEEEVKKFAKALEGCTPEEIVSKTVLFTCNSIVVNLWNVYGDEFKKFYEKAKAELNTEPDVEPEVETGNKA